MFNNKFKNDSVADAVKKIMEDDKCVTKPEAKKIAKKEVSHHNVTMHKGQKDNVKEEAKGESEKDFMARQKRLAAASAETEKNPEKMKRLSKIPGYTGAMDLAKKTVNKEENEKFTFKDKLIQSLKENKATGTEELFTDNNIGEMSDAQMKRREKIVLSMKDKQADFKKKYGARWKDVMYATATKMAMNEESDVENLDEKHGASSRSDKEKEATDAAQQTLDFMKAGGKIQTEPKKTRKPRKITKSTFLGTYKSGMREENVVEEVEEDVAEGFKVGDSVRHKDGLSGTVTKDEDKDGIVDWKGPTAGHRASHSSVLTKNTEVPRWRKVKTEEVEAMDEKIHPTEKTVDMLRGPVKVSSNYDNEHKSYKVKLSSEDKMGETDWVRRKDTEKDKSGAIHTPMSRARHLARLALQKTKEKK